MSNLKDQMNEGAKEYGAEGGGQFQFSKSGKYSLRILCQPIAIATHFFGKGNPSHVCVGKDKGCPYHTEGITKPSVKFITYVIDRQDENKVKIAELPWAVISEVAEFQEEPEYAFEEYPIPYDIHVTCNKEASSPADIYKTMAARNNEEVPAEILADFEEKMKAKTPEQYVEGRKNAEVAKLEAEKQWDGEAQQTPADDYPEYEGEPTI